jgi:hypothetical protein
MTTTADDFTARAHAAITDAVNRGFPADAAAAPYFLDSPIGRELAAIGAALREQGRRLKAAVNQWQANAACAPEGVEEELPGGADILGETMALRERARALWPHGAGELAALLAGGTPAQS